MPKRQRDRRVTVAGRLGGRRVAAIVGAATLAVVILGVAAIVVGRRGGSTGSRALSSASSTPGHAPTGGPLIPVAQRLAAPEFSVQTAPFGDGSVFDLAHERGHVVVVYFMAGWCLTCIPEASALAKLQEQYGANGVRILALDVDRTEGDTQLAEFRARAGNGRYLWGFDRDLRIAQALNVRSLDSTIVVDRDGRIAYRDSVPTPYDTLATVVRALS